MKSSINVLIDQNDIYVINLDSHEAMLLGKRDEDLQEFLASLPSGASLRVYLNLSDEDYEYEHFRSASFLDRKALLRRTIRKLGITESKFVRHVWIKSPGTEGDKKGYDLEVAHIKSSLTLERVIEAAHKNGILISSICSIVDEWRKLTLGQAGQFFPSDQAAALEAFIVAIETSGGIRIITFEKNGKILANLFFDDTESFPGSVEKVLRYVKTQHPSLVDGTGILLATSNPAVVDEVKGKAAQSGFSDEKVVLAPLSENQARQSGTNSALYITLEPVFHKPGGFSLRNLRASIPHSCYEDKVSNRVLETRRKTIMAYTAFFLVAASASAVIAKDYLEIAAIKKGMQALEEKRAELDKITDALSRVIKLPYETKDMNLVLDFSKRFEKEVEQVSATEASRVAWGAFMSGKDTIMPTSYKITRNYKSGDFVSSQFTVALRADAVSTDNTLKSKNELIDRAVHRLMKTGCFKRVDVTLHPGSSGKGKDALEVSEEIYSTRHFSFALEGDMDLKRAGCIAKKTDEKVKHGKRG